MAGLAAEISAGRHFSKPAWAKRSVGTSEQLALSPSHLIVDESLGAKNPKSFGYWYQLIYLEPISLTVTQGHSAIDDPFDHHHARRDDLNDRSTKCRINERY